MGAKEERAQSIIDYSQFQLLTSNEYISNFKKIAASKERV